MKKKMNEKCKKKLTGWTVETIEKERTLRTD